MALQFLSNYEIDESIFLPVGSSENFIQECHKYLIIKLNAVKSFGNKLVCPDANLSTRLLHPNYAGAATAIEYMLSSYHVIITVLLLIRDESIVTINIPALFRSHAL